MTRNNREPWGWMHIRSYPHPALHGRSLELEIHPDTLQFRIGVQQKSFTGTDPAQLFQQAQEYVQTLSVPGNWQPIIELAWYSSRMEATRFLMHVEEDGTCLQHPWVEDRGKMTLLHISALRYHDVDVAQVPCRHYNGLSSYYHLPYTLTTWEQVQALVRHANEAVYSLRTFLDAMSTVPPSAHWETQFQALWRELPPFSRGRANRTPKRLSGFRRWGRGCGRLPSLIAHRIS